MRIGYASQSFYPHIGGVSTYLLNLAKELVARGHTVTEVHLRTSGEESDDEIKGIEIHKVPREPIDREVMRSYSKFKEAVYKESHYHLEEFTKAAPEMEGFSAYNEVNEYFGEELREVFKRSPADIVHIHDFQLLFTYRYVPRGTPCILTWHIPFTEEISPPLREFLIRQMNEYDKVIFSSPDYIKAAVDGGLSRQKATLIYPIANTNLFRQLDVDKKEVRRGHKLPEGAKIILCVQRIDPKSGHEQLIRALPLIKKQVREAKLLFVGGESLSNKLSPERAQLAKRIHTLVKELKLEEDVLFTGNIDYHELPELYNSVDLVALCSKNEGFGLSVTEGMACGNPIVGTKVGGIPLQVTHGENGLLVDVGDVRGTAEAITRILTEPKLRERMAAASLEAVEKRFKLEKGVEKHLALYTKLLGEKDQFRTLEHLDRNEVKALVTDYDRTITERAAKPDFDPADLDKGLLREMEGLGLDLLLATGRNIRYVRKLCDHAGIWRCAIAENGAVIYFPKTRKTITINTTAMTKAKRLVREMALPGVVLGKVIASIPARHEKRVREGLGKLAHEVKFVRNVDEVMLLPDGVDKGVGLHLALRYLNIDEERIVIAGDGENDADMFVNPGFKVAVANADKELKRLADHITHGPATQGVREIIAQLREAQP